MQVSCGGVCCAGDMGPLRYGSGSGGTDRCRQHFCLGTDKTVGLSGFVMAVTPLLGVTKTEKGELAHVVADHSGAVESSAKDEGFGYVMKRARATARESHDGTVAAGGGGVAEVRHDTGSGSIDSRRTQARVRAT